MTPRIWMLGLLIAAPAFGQSMGPSKSIFPPYSSSVFPAPSLQGSVSATGPRWPSAAKAAQKVEKGVLAVGDFATSAPVGAAVDAIKDAALKDADALRELKTVSAKFGQEGIDGLTARFGKTDNPAFKTSLDQTRGKISAELDALDKGADAAERQAGFLSKLGNALTVLDFVSVAAQGAGYLYEGDATGAAGVVANEAAKKTAEAVGAFGFSWAPGGAVYGSWGGNKAWEKYVKPVIDAREQAMREAELKRQIANKPWLEEKEFLDANGHSRRMAVDEYIDRDSGLVKRRNPADQAKFEATAHAKWKSQKAMAEVEADHAAGRIDDQALREAQTSFRNRDPGVPWEPPGFALIPEPDMPEVEVPEASESEAVPEETVVETYDELAGYPAVQLTASGSMTETIDGWGDMTTRFEFAFWNLGAYSRGHDRAVLQIINSGEGSQTLVGVFSGGPNGTLVFQDDEGGSHSFRVEGGAVVVAELERLVANGTEVEVITLRMPISDPGAFADWPEGLR